MAQPKKEFNWDKLDALLQFKVPLKFVGEYLEVSIDTVQRRIKNEKGVTFEEYAALKLQRTAVKLQQKAIEMALAGNTSMMIFALKNLAGWSDKLESTTSVSDLKIEISKEENDL